MSTTPVTVGPLAERLEARRSLIGTDTLIRRALPHRNLHMVGAWCFLDHAGPVQFEPGQGMHVGPHPHIGLQTFTWMMEGEVRHRDSLGFNQVIRPGQVNLMTAGRGISHSEDSVTDGGRLHAAQLWIALPDAQRHCEPAFEHHADLPVVEQGGFRITVLAGSACGLTSPVTVYSPMVGLDLTTPTAAYTTLVLNPKFEHAALVLRGQVSVAGEALDPGTLLDLGAGRDSLAVQCGDAAQLLILGGEPFGEDVLLWWNFVARTQAELEQAVADWNSGSERFGSVQGAGAAPLHAPSLTGMRLRASPSRSVG